MVRNYNLFALISLLFAASLMLSTWAVSQSAQITISAPYVPQSLANGPALPLQSQSSYPLSPAQTVYNYNNQNAGYLLNCELSLIALSGNPAYLLVPYPGDFGDWQVYGNPCVAPSSSTSIPITLYMTANVPTIQGGLPRADFVQVSLSMQGAVNAVFGNIGYNPEVSTPAGNVLSTAFNSKSYIFQTIPVSGQQGLWTWYALAIDPAKFGSVYSPGQLQVTLTSPGNTYSTDEVGSCAYTYTVISNIQLTGVSAGPSIPFPTGPSTTTTNVNILPYLLYNATIINAETGNQFNYGLSYDLFSPYNYQSPYTQMDPFPVNALPFLFAGTVNSSGSTSPGNPGYTAPLTYYPIQNVQYSGNQGSNDIGLAYPQITQNTPGGQSGACPNKEYPAGDTTDQLTVAQAVACAQEAGFTGQALVNFVEIGYEESSWHPGETEFGQVAGSPPSCGGPGSSPGSPQACAAVGILQAGSYLDSWGAYSVAGYNPNSCATYLPGPEWEGIYLNPLCEYTWAYNYFKNSGTGYEFWGGTATSCGRDCNIAVSENPGLPTEIQDAILASPSPLQSGGTGGGSVGTYAYPVGNGCVAERTDQGKDWGNSCPLYALGAGTITNVYSKPGGWPGGTFIVLQLSNPPDAQHTYAYYAEYITPEVTVGQTVTAGQQIGLATGGSSGIELGWAAPPPDTGESLNTYLNGPYAGSGPTPEGTNYANFINGIQSGIVGGSSGTASAGTAIVNTTITPISISAVPSGYIYVLGTSSIPIAPPISIGVCNPPTTNSYSPVTNPPTGPPQLATVTGGGTAWFIETVNNANGDLGTPSFPIQFQWYTGEYTGPNPPAAPNCVDASCLSPTDCNPYTTQITSATSDSVGIPFSNVNEKCDVWVNVQSLAPQCAGIHYSYSTNAYVNAQTGSASSSSSQQPNSPPAPPASTTKQTTFLFVLKVIPKGQLNLTAYPPNSIQQTSDPASFASEVSTYWKNVQTLQGTSVYVVSQIPVLADPTLSQIQFQPQNISADNIGDVFMVGHAQNPGGAPSSTYLVRVTNTLGEGPLTVTSASICADSAAQGVGSGLCGNGWPEIASSPTGAQIYLANIQSGYIPIFSGSDLSYQTYLNLGFSTDATLYSGAAAVTSTGQPLELNMLCYFQNGGLYGAQSSTEFDSLTTNINGGTSPCTFNPPSCGGPGQPSCNGNDKIMTQIVNNYNLATAGLGSGYFAAGQDQLDKSNWPGGGNGNVNSNYHHPLAIQDVNGYLYVLDDWSGITGEVCSIQIKGVNGCPSGFDVGGILFNILDLRVINSSGVDIPIIPTYVNDLSSCSNIPGVNGGCQGYNPFNPATYDLSRLLYPPFGWIISANVTAQNGAGSIGPIGGGNEPVPPALAFCSGPQGTPNYNCRQPNSNSYRGTLLPVGPVLKNWGSCNDAPGQGYHALELLGTGFSVSFNNTVQIFVPSQSNIPNPDCNSNQNSELLFAKIPPENYTNQIGGPNLLPFSQGAYYQCYTGTQPTSSQSGGICKYDTNVNKLLQPTYEFANPFEYDSNIGSFQALTLAEQLSADINGASQTNPSAPNTGINNPTLVTAETNQYNSAYNPSSAQTPLHPTTLESQISGYALMPVQYTYKDNWYVTNIQPNYYVCAIPPELSSLESMQSTTSSIYNFTGSNTVTSGVQAADIESGSTYAQSQINTTQYYEPALNAIIAPRELFYSLLTNRIFGDTYVNGTLSAVTNNQEVINSTQLFTYTDQIYGQGPSGTIAGGYAVINVHPKNPICSGPGAACSSPQLTQPISLNIKNNFAAYPEGGSPILVALFDWYKIPVHDTALDLALNGSNGQYNAYGYHRFVYVYNDRFNNTIYMPLDVDVSNITQLNLSVHPIINATDANQTKIRVNGTAFWLPPFSTTDVPLQNGAIYLYFDANLNTFGYNAVQNPASAALCIFANSTSAVSSLGSKNCQYTNPVAAGLGYNPSGGQYPDGSYSITSNVTTFHTAYNLSGMCSPPPKSLLEPAGKVYTLCNIYGPTAAGRLSATCPASTQGNTQYCLPLFNNGTGICTPQLGLFNITHTNAKGYFNANITVCGYGIHTVVAKYYGTPGPEPITAVQSPIPLAANPSVSSAIPPSVSFSVFNYSWSPTQQSESVTIGTILLNLGNINTIAALIVIIAASIILISIRMGKKPKGRRKR